MKRAICIVLACAGCSSAPRDFSTDDAGVAPDVAAADPCAGGYPLGPYGTGAGQTVNPGLQWQGYLPSTASSVGANDLFDCDGSKGINALVFDVAAEWCAACQSQASSMNSLTTPDATLGIKVVTLVVQDNSEAPATIKTAQDWKNQYSLTDVTVCADPAFSFAPANVSSVDLPVTVIVDPRTMKIMQVQQGYIAAYPVQPNATAVAIAKKNGGGSL